MSRSSDASGPCRRHQCSGMLCPFYQGASEYLLVKCIVCEYLQLHGASQVTPVDDWLDLIQVPELR